MKELRVHNGEIQKELVKRLKENKLKIATAESLTGGLLSKMLTEIPGASEVFECGVCSYSNRIKHDLLKVSQNTLDKYTEYSRQTAGEMAQGVRILSGADIGVSTTGIAGPGGGSQDKPVGLVYVGISTKNDRITYELKLADKKQCDREYIRQQAARYAFSAVLDFLDENY